MLEMEPVTQLQLSLQTPRTGSEALLLHMQSTNLSVHIPLTDMRTFSDKYQLG